jgi:hypothetical protein
MKTKYGIILLLIGIIVCSVDALAFDYTFKTTVTREVTNTLQFDNTPGCDGSTPNNPPIEYKARYIDSFFTHFSIRIVKKSDNSAYFDGGNHTVVHGGNFNLETGELTYTIADIPKTKEILVIRFYTNNNASGQPYAEQEISATGDTRGKAGYVTFGNVGDGSDGGGGGGAISGYDGVVTGASISNGVNYSEITVNFQDFGDANYAAMVSVQSIGNRFNDNNITTPVVYAKNGTSFKVLLEKNPTGNPANLRLDIIIQPY